MKAEAARLGFPLVGIAPAETFGAAQARFVEWVRLGRQGDMRWIDESRARRSSQPDKLLADARSLIGVALAYSDGSEDAPLSPLAGRVARYARGDDYHDLMVERLRQLVAALRSRIEERFTVRLFVDTGPILDREVAARAGLGFYGKNTCILTAPLGSYCFLGAILTDLELAHDAPIVKDCGRCRLCLDACPTGALVAPYELDARRCISYLTIELRGSVAQELREPMGQHVFGCDICQQVCPWNRSVGPIVWPELLPRENVGAELALTEILALDEDGFRQRFRKSPIKRAKRRGLLRNAAIALGNTGDARAVPALIGALGDGDPLVRGHAAWALGKLGGAEAGAALEKAARTEADSEVLWEVHQALQNYERNQLDNEGAMVHSGRRPGHPVSSGDAKTVPIP